MTARTPVMLDGEILRGQGGLNVEATSGTINIGNNTAGAVVIGRSGITVTLPGNLVVQGSTTTIETTNLVVEDALIYGNNGGPDPSFCGIAWDQGASDDVIIVWNSTDARFELGRFNTVGGTAVPGAALSTFADLKCGAIEATSISIGTSGFLNIGSATSAVSNGDLAASNGTSEWFYDPSADRIIYKDVATALQETFTARTVYASNAEPFFRFYSYNNSSFAGPSMVFGHFGGAIGARTQTGSGWELGEISFQGLDNTASPGGRQLGARICVTSAAAFTSASSPAYIDFETTAAGSTTPTARWRVETAGHLVPVAGANYTVGSASNSVDRFFADNGTNTLPAYTFSSATGTGLSNSGGILVLSAGGFGGWEVRTDRHLVPYDDNTFNIGESSNRVQNIYYGTTIFAGNTGGGGTFNFFGVDRDNAGVGNALLFRAGAGHTTGAGGAFTHQGGTGGDAVASTSNGSNGGLVTVAGGTGGLGATGPQTGGNGGGLDLQGGAGGAANGGTAGNPGAITIGNTNTASVTIAGATSTSTVIIGNAAAGAVTIDSSAGISLDGASACNFTTSSGDLTLSVTGSGATVSIAADTGGTGSISLEAGTQTEILANGTGADAVNIAPANGGVTISAADATNGNVSIDANVNITIGGTNANTVQIGSTAGNPALNFFGEIAEFRIGATDFRISNDAGTQRFTLDGSGDARVSSGGAWAWSGTTASSGSLDTWLQRGGAGIIDVNASDTGAGDGTLQLRQASYTDGNGGKLDVLRASQELTGLSGASATTTTLVPAGARILFITARVTTTITGCTTIDIGDGTDVDRYGTGIALTAGTTVDGTDATADPEGWSASAQNVTVTAVGGGASFTAGAIRIVAYYILPTAPTS